MPRFLLKFIVGAAGLWLASEIVRGFEIGSLGTLIAAAILLGLVNALVRPVLIILTLPITVLTLGLFLIVINAITIGIVAWLLKGMHVDGLWPAMMAALVVGLTSWLAEAILGVNRRVEV